MSKKLSFKTILGGCILLVTLLFLFLFGTSVSAQAAEGDVTVDTSLTATFDGRGYVTIPKATITNHLDYEITVTSAEAPDGYGWTCDAVGKTIRPGEALTALWSSSAPISAETAEEAASDGNLYIGDAVYHYSYTLPDPVAFAVYSADDGSLDFYKRITVPEVGDMFNGKTVTNVYTGVEDTGTSSSAIPWYGIRTSITSATVIDEEIQPVSTASWFNGCSNLTDMDLSKLDVSNVTTMNSMFYGCFNLPNADSLADWNTGKVSDMESMFYNCNDLSSTDGFATWDVSNVTTMSTMFYNCALDLNTDGFLNWDTGNVTTMSNMFRNTRVDTKSLQNWDLSSCTSIAGMFYNSNLVSFEGLENWDTSNVENMGSLFMYSKFESADFSKWDTHNVKYMGDMFVSCAVKELDLSSWDTTNVTDMDGMFRNSHIESLNISSWDTANVDTMRHMFQECYYLAEITLGEKFSSPNDNRYFYFPVPSNNYIDGADGYWYNSKGEAFLPGDIPYNVADTYYAVMPKAFAVYSADDHSLNFYKRATVPSVGELFNGKTVTHVYKNAESIIADSSERYPYTTLPWFDVYDEIVSITIVDGGIQPENPSYWFASLINLTSVDLEKLDVSSVTDLSYMFDMCHKLTSVDSLASWDVGNVTSMYSMFTNCDSLSSVDALSNWNTENVTTMAWMFRECESLEQVSLNWNTSSVIDMSDMFGSCTALKQADLSSWSSASLVRTGNMLNYCRQLEILTLGKDFAFASFDPLQAYLGAPDPDYIDGADGYWYNSKGEAFLREDIPAYTADTYYAVKPESSASAVSVTDHMALHERAGIPTVDDLFPEAFVPDVTEPPVTLEEEPIPDVPTATEPEKPITDPVADPTVPTDGSKEEANPEENESTSENNDPPIPKSSDETFSKTEE